MLNQQSRRLYVSVFVASLGLGTYIYFIPVFAQTFGATFLDLGFIGSAGALAYAMTPILIAYLADRFNRVWLFSLGLTINALATIVLVLTRSVGDIVLLRLLGGFGYGFFWPSAEVLVTDLAPVEKRVREMGYYSVAWASGFLIGPLIGGYIVQSFGYVALFTISTVLIAIALVFTVVWVAPGYRPKIEMRPDFSGSGSTIRKLASWYLMILCYGVVFSVIATIFPGYANSVGVSPAIIGLFFTVFGISRIVIFATSERYARLGEKRALLFSSVILATGVLIIGVFSNFPAFLVSSILVGGSFGVIFPLTISLISRHFPNERLGVAVGSYETVFGVGFTVGPVLAGVIASLSNISLSFLLMSFFGFLMVPFVITAQIHRETSG